MAAQKISVSLDAEELRYGRRRRCGVVTALSPTWDPAGQSANNRRPVVIVGQDAQNMVVERWGAGPLTGNVERVYEFQVFLPAGRTGLTKDSKAQAELIRAISINRLASSCVGAVPEDLMRRVDAALKLHLGLS